MNKFQKKKQRERAVKEKTLKRRAAIQAHNREEKLERKIYRAERKLTDPQTPIKKAWEPEMSAKRDAAIKKKLAHNMEILSALEAEYEAEKKQRDELNSSLEEEGHLTPEDKIRALADKHKEAAEQREEVN